MAKANRETLKEYFSSGKIPTERQFGDLIESMLNIVDDGMNRTAGQGLQLSPLDESGPVLEFFANILDEVPLWKINIDKKQGILGIYKGDEEMPFLILDADHRMKITGDIEVNGNVTTSGLVGNYRIGKVPADGKWHDITDENASESSGCRAYRVMAGCGRKGKGKYALLEATAIHCYGKHRRISYCQSWYGMHFNRLKMRWKQEGEAWRLQIRSRCDYGGETYVRFQVTELWQDYFMNR